MRLRRSAESALPTELSPRAQQVVGTAWQPEGAWCRLDGAGRGRGRCWRRTRRRPGGSHEMGPGSSRVAGEEIERGRHVEKPVLTIRGFSGAEEIYSLSTFLRPTPQSHGSPQRLGRVLYIAASALDSSGSTLQPPPSPSSSPFPFSASPSTPVKHRDDCPRRELLFGALHLDIIIFGTAYQVTFTYNQVVSGCYNLRYVLVVICNCG